MEDIMKKDKYTRIHNTHKLKQQQTHKDMKYWIYETQTKSNSTVLKEVGPGMQLRGTEPDQHA